MGKKPISFSFDESMNKLLIDAVKNGVRPSKSFIVRECIEKHLPIMIREHIETINRLMEEQNIPDIIDYMKSKGFYFVKRTGYRAKVGKKPIGNIFYDEFFDKKGKLKYLPKKAIVEE